jgi:hypothetical protein
MTPKPECINCHKLGKCGTATPLEIVASFCCDRWEPEAVEVVAARETAIRVFGDAALKMLTHPEMD